MNTRTAEEISKVIEKGNGSGRLSFRGMTLPDADFSGMELRSADFRGARLPFANFRSANLKYATFESASLHGADFTDANLHRASFKDADLSGTKMFAKDLYGVTITLQCTSFLGMEMDEGWWYGWLYYGLLMKPPSVEAEEKLILALGPERYMVLRKQYAGREV